MNIRFQPCRALRIQLIMIGLLSLVGCNALYFYPQKQLLDNPTARIFLPEDVYFKTSDGLMLHGWFIRARNAKATILVLHGNAENVSTHVNGVLWLVPEGFQIFIFDYRGYGRSQGKPSIAGVLRDAEAALDTLLSIPGVNQQRIIVFGQSLGGAIAITMVSGSPHRGKIKALVVESAFSSYRRIAREKMGEIWLTWPFQYPFSFLFNDDFSPIDRVRNVTPIPLLIIQGREDTVVPIHHGRLLYQAAAEPKLFWETSPAGHVRSFADAEVRKQFVEHLNEIIERSDQGGR